MEKYQEQVYNILNNLIVNYNQIQNSLEKLNEEFETISIDIYNKHRNNEEQNVDDFRRNWLVGLRIEYLNFDSVLVGTRIKMCYELLALWKVDLDLSEDNKTVLSRIMSIPQLNVQNVYDPIERRMVDIYPDRGNILMERSKILITEEKIPLLLSSVIENIESKRKFEEEQKAAQDQENFKDEQ